jgi:hypothetical protein
MVLVFRKKLRGSRIGRYGNQTTRTGKMLYRSWIVMLYLSGQIALHLSFQTCIRHNFT